MASERLSRLVWKIVVFCTWMGLGFGFTVFPAATRR